MNARVRATPFEAKCLYTKQNSVVHVCSLWFFTEKENKVERKQHSDEAVDESRRERAQRLLVFRQKDTVQPKSLSKVLHTYTRVQGFTVFFHTHQNQIRKKKEIITALHE